MAVNGAMEDPSLNFGSFLKRARHQLSRESLFYGGAL